MLIGLHSLLHSRSNRWLGLQRRIHRLDTRALHLPLPFFMHSRISSNPPQRVFSLWFWKDCCTRGSSLLWQLESGLNFYCNLLTVPKPNGDIWPILDFKGVKFLQVQIFRIECPWSVIALLYLWTPWLQWILRMSFFFYPSFAAICSGRLTIHLWHYLLTCPKHYSVGSSSQED